MPLTFSLAILFGYLITDGLRVSAHPIRPFHIFMYTAAYTKSKYLAREPFGDGVKDAIEAYQPT